MANRWEDFLERFGKMEQMVLDSRSDIKDMKKDIETFKLERAKILGMATAAGGVASLLLAAAKEKLFG